MNASATATTSPAYSHVRRVSPLSRGGIGGGRAAAVAVRRGCRRPPCWPKRQSSTENNINNVRHRATARVTAAAAEGGVELYGSPGSRSPLVNWYLHELDVDFEDRAPSDPSNPHPFGRGPFQPVKPSSLFPPPGEPSREPPKPPLVPSKVHGYMKDHTVNCTLNPL